MRRAFTLLELLTTVAIVGIIAALLLSAIERGRSAAQKSTCINNVRQITMALLLYAGDHADGLRAATNDYHIYFTYKASVLPYLSQNGLKTNDPLFICPADNFDCTKPVIEKSFWPSVVAGRGLYHLKQTEYSSYCYNGEAGNSLDKIQNEGERVSGKPFSFVRQPSRLVLECEYSGLLGLSAHDRKQAGQFNNAKSVMGFVDGHVSFVPVYWNGADIPSDYNPPAGYDYLWFDK